MQLFKRILGLQDPFELSEKVAEDFPESDPTVLDWLHETFPSRSQLLQYGVGLFPFGQWLGHYNLQWFFGDLVAGVTVGAVVIPESMGFAKLAGLPTHYGLYTSFMGGIMYWIFATSKDVTIGPVAILFTVTGAIISIVQSYPGIPGPQIAMAVSIICGIIVTFVGLARLGFILDFNPLPSITSFMTGSAIMICSGQVKDLLGETASFSLDALTYRTIINVLKHLPSAKGYDAAMGVSALVLLYGTRTMCNYGAQWYPRRAKLFIFISNLRKLFVILFFTMISAIVNLHREDIPVFAIVGYVPRGFEDAGVPTLSGDVIKSVIPKLPAAVVVMVLEHVATSKSYSRINNYTVNQSQELIAIGVTNLLGPFVGGYPATVPYRALPFSRKLEFAPPWLHLRHRLLVAGNSPVSPRQSPQEGDVEKPRPGVFIFHFSEGINHPNVSHYLDTLVQNIPKGTRRTHTIDFGKKGDLPWNDPKPRNTENKPDSDQLPLLRAVIFDISAVNNVDVTSIQGLIDVRSQLNRHAAPSEVQWHFANIQSRWTKRALAAARFGYPVNPSLVEGQDIGSAKQERGEASDDVEKGMKANPYNGQAREKELRDNEACSTRIEHTGRPFFHVDLIGALESVDAYLAMNSKL